MMKFQFVPPATEYFHYWQYSILLPRICDVIQLAANSYTWNQGVTDWMV
jgi:hypothetical protein